MKLFTEPIINEDDSWLVDGNKRRDGYKVFEIQFIHGCYTVIADCEQNAIDEFIDWCEDNAPGYISQYDELDDIERDELICGGNHGVYLNEMPHAIIVIA